MKKILTLNVFGAIFGFVFAIQCALYLNSGRITRMTDWPYDKVSMLIFIINIVILIASTILIIALSKKYINKGALRFALTILWAPYSYLILFIIWNLFPITDPGDKNLGGAGFIIMGFMVLYPFYIAILLAASTKESTAKG